MADEAKFSVEMRKFTKTIHKTSDSMVNAKFVLSLTDPEVWTEALLSFYEVFLFLEEAKERLNMKEINQLFVHDELHRVKSFELDLQHYLGNDWKLQRKLDSPGVQTYLQHLSQIEENNPVLLIAYYYHLYLGILSGGQILKRKRKLFDKVQLSKKGDAHYEEKVLSFDCMEIISTKNLIKERLDCLTDVISNEVKHSILNESVKVFEFNNLVVSEIKGQNFQLLKDVITYAFFPLLIFIILVVLLISNS